MEGLDIELLNFLLCDDAEHEIGLVSFRNFPILEVTPVKYSLDPLRMKYDGMAKHRF